MSEVKSTVNSVKSIVESIDQLESDSTAVDSFDRHRLSTVTEYDHQVHSTYCAAVAARLDAIKRVISRTDRSDIVCRRV